MYLFHCIIPPVKFKLKKLISLFLSFFFSILSPLFSLDLCISSYKSRSTSAILHAVVDRRDFTVITRVLSFPILSSGGRLFECLCVRSPPPSFPILRVFLCLLPSHSVLRFTSRVNICATFTSLHIRSRVLPPVVQSKRT